MKFFVVKILIALLITAIIVGGLGSLALWAKFTQENPIYGIGIAISLFISIVIGISLKLANDEYKENVEYKEKENVLKHFRENETSEFKGVKYNPLKYNSKNLPVSMYNSYFNQENDFNDSKR